ncbi:putative metallo-hydrolase [mine drainage metagenome]|uniref:Putative metallo-hydrolase n=1 Tax=mine drainage metagenome TaxID=410659 RepID=A0A1J5RKF6_9ZZZZ
MKPRLPQQVRVLERGWLSSNNILLLEGERATLVDSGYISHAQQTLALVREALDGRRLARIINSHSHSDHIGGNATLQRELGCAITVPEGIAAAIAAWDEDFLLLKPSGQRGDRFRHDAVIKAGEEFELAGLVWRALAAPGHDMAALVFHCQSARLLISGDALWRDGFGIQFAEISGQAAGLAATRATLEAIGRLAVDVVIPGHGAPFAEFDDAMARALQRVAAFEQNPARMVRSAIKALFAFNLLELRRLRRDRLAGYLESIPFFHDAHARLHQPTAGLAEWLLEELLRAGVVELQGEDIVPTQTA